MTVLRNRGGSKDSKSGKSGGKSGSGGGGKKTDEATLVPTTRNLAVRVYTAHKRSHSSTLWLERQLNDPYVAEAKKQGWRSRAAFKLLQLDDKFKLLHPGMRVVDLGAAPGGWTQVAVQKVHPERGKGVVVGLDILEMEAVPGATTYQADFTAEGEDERLKKVLNGPADIVMSDMAAPTVGHTQTDHYRIMALAELAAIFACEVLSNGGTFVCKLFQGGAEKSLNDLLKKNFRSVKYAKPAASRADSAETYVVATGFRGHKESH